MTYTPRPDSFTVRLDREWARLRFHPSSIGRARTWAGPGSGGPFGRQLATIADLQTIIDLTRGGGAADASADALLCRLIEVAEHDVLAGRVVIQRILPGLISRSARYRNRRDTSDPVDVVVAAAWIAMRRYDWRRRNRHVAASLISDATFQAFRRPLRLRAASEETRAPNRFWRIPASAEPANATDELASVLRAAGDAGVPDPDLELIRQLVRRGSPAGVAADCGVTPRTIRNRRNAAIARVQAALAAA